MADCLLFIVNDPGFFVSHRLPIALVAREAGYEVHIASAAGLGIEKIREQGLVHHALPLSRSGRNPIAELRAIVAIGQLLRKLRPSIVHLVTIKPVLYGGIAARWFNVPAVVAAISGLGFVFIQDSHQARLIRFFVGLLYRLALGHRNLRVIFQNHDDKREIARLVGLTAQQVVLIRGSGVDLQHYSQRPWPQEAVVIMACRMLVDKGVLEFIQAAYTLRHRGNKARFILVGALDEKNPASLKINQISDAVSQGVVEWWGHRSDADMPEVLSQAQLVVLPSYREGLPKVLIEAAACGRAIVATDVPGCRDAITPGTTGVLVPARNAQALADAIDNLLEDGDRCREMGEAGRTLAVSVFDVRQVVAAHMAVYRDLGGQQ